MQELLAKLREKLSNQVKDKLQDEEALLEQAEGGYGSELDSLLEAGDRLFNLDKTIHALRLPMDTQPLIVNPQVSDEVFGEYYGPTLVEAPRFQPATFLQLAAAIQRGDDEFAVGLVMQLLQLENRRALELVSQLQQRWKAGVKVGVYCACIDMLLAENGPYNDLLQHTQELFGVPGDIALQYHKTYENTWGVT